MTRLITTCTAALMGMAALVMPASAEITEADRKMLNAMIEDYIRANPEVVREVLIQLGEREAEERRQAAMEVLKNDAGDPFIGNADASFVIYEFSDYNCGYCKRVFQPLQDLVNEDGDIKLVLKEFPILSQTSLLAAQGAIAAQAQGVFPDYHRSLMTSRGAIDMDTILAAARDAGADLDRLQEDMNSAETSAIIDRTRDAAQRLEISGTPGLIIGTQVIPGAISLEQMRETVAAERAKRS